MIATFPARAARGFLLIGVIMFVLALSILGLSLYSLSSYEAQFLRQSHDSNVALYRSQGALEMVKAILAQPPYTLVTARGAIGHEGVAWTRAYQMHTNGSIDSLGTIDFSDTVSVDVIVRQGSTSRYLHANFLPQPRQDYYKRLLTTAGLIECPGVNSNSGKNNKNAVQLNGRMWQPSGFDSTVWRTNLVWTNGPPLKRGDVALPDLAAYFANHNVLTPTVVDSGQVPGGEGESDEHVIAMDAGSGVGYFASPFNSYRAFQKKLKVTVRGRCVWIVPAGFRTMQRFTVEGSGSNPTLILVAGQNGVEPFGESNAGIWCFGGIEAQNAAVILVSDGKVNLEQFNEFDNDQTASRLAIYAGRVRFMGPDPNNRMALSYDPSLDSIIDDLYANGALPLPPGTASNSFTFVKGSWRELKP